MEAYRLKNIAIVVLLLLDGCLLLLVGHQHLQEKQAEGRAAVELRKLCEGQQLAVGDTVDLGQAPLAPLALARRPETEQAIASYLLGGDAVSASQGGDIFSYEADGGAIQFRAGGGFYGSRLSVPVEDAESFFKEFCRKFGYEGFQAEVDREAVMFSAAQRLAGVPVGGCEVTMRFEGGALVSVTGAHVSLEEASAQPGEQMSCMTALVRFLDYRSASGAVCSEVHDIRCVYQLQSAGPLRLLPVWQIETDTYTYSVDCASGEVAGH